MYIFFHSAILPLGVPLRTNTHNCTKMCIKRASLVAQMVKCLPAMQETQVQALGWEDPLKKEMATHVYRICLPMQERWVQSLSWEDPLEKKMATHSSILAWEIHGQRRLASCSPWGCKESDMTEQLSTHVNARVLLQLFNSKHSKSV